MVAQAWSWDLIKLLCLFIRQFATSMDALFRVTVHIVRPTRLFLRQVFHTQVIFGCSCRNSWFEHLSVFLNHTSVRCAFTLSTSQVHEVKKWWWFSKINGLHQCLPHRTHILRSSSQFHVVHVYRQEESLFFDEQIDMSSSGTSSHPNPNRTFSNCLSHKRPSSVCPYKFRSRRTTDSSMFHHDFDHTVVEDVSIYIWTFWLWIFLQPWRVLHLYLNVSGHCVSPLVLHNQVVLQGHPLTFAVLIWDTDEPCSVKHGIRSCVFHNVTSEHDSSFVFWYFSNSTFFEMTDVHQRGKMDCSLLFVCFKNNLLFAVYVGQLPGQLFELLPLRAHCCLLHPELSLLSA